MTVPHLQNPDMHQTSLSCDFIFILKSEAHNACAVRHHKGPHSLALHADGLEKPKDPHALKRRTHATPDPKTAHDQQVLIIKRRLKLHYCLWLP